MSSQNVFRYSHTLGMYALRGRGFNNPVDLAEGRDGVLYVLNRAGPEVELRMENKRVTMCTANEEYLGDFSTGGDGDGELWWPVSIAVDANENVYISDEALHRISVFDKGMQFLGKWGVRGKEEGQFDRPAGIVFDKEDNLLVVDSVNNRVQRYTKDGVFLGGWGGRGNADGEFDLPWGINIDPAGNVYVADWRNDRIQKFDAQGSHLATMGTSGKGDGELNRPAGVAVDQDGDIYVADWGNERVQVLHSDGRFLDSFRGDAGLSKWSDDYFKANQDELEERQKADMEPELDLWPDDGPREESANIEKLFWGPTSVIIDGEGRILVVDSGRYRVQIYRKEVRPSATSVSAGTDMGTQPS